MEVLVSINCITYNHEKYIAEAIEGFLMQKTDFDFEILIGEDCSTDKTRKIVQEYVKKYPDKIKLVCSESNVGFKENAKRLHENSRGKYIAICEGDDYWTKPYKLQKQIDYLEKNPDCTLCFHASDIVRARDRSVVTILRPYKNNTVCSAEDIIKGGGGFCPTQSIIYRKSCFDRPPEFYYNSPMGDYPMQMIVASQGYAYYIDEVMAAYRKGTNGSWSNQTNSVRCQIDLNFKTIELLNEFYKYSNYKYEKAITEMKLICEFDSLVLQRKRRQLRCLRYMQYYSKLSTKEKIKVCFKSFFPELYLKLIEMRYM